MPEQQRYARDPEKHRAIARKSYHAHRLEINKRRKQRRDLRRAAQGITPDPLAAARMAVLRAARRRVLQQEWTRDLCGRMGAIIAENATSRHTRKSLYWAVRLILTRAEKDGLAQERDITPAWLAGFPRQTKDLRKEPIYRANFGRMLLRLGLWSQKDYQLFRQNSEASFGRWKNRGGHLHGPKATHGAKPTPSPPVELCRLVQELAYRCGLSTGEMRELCVTYIQADGLRIPPKPQSEKPRRLAPKLGRLIPFGDGWDEIPKTTLNAYVNNEKPTDYLFFSRSPRDKKKPISKMTLNGALVAQKITIQALRNQHFDKDFRRARSLQDARFHLRNVHDLENQYVHNLIAGSHSHKGYANEADTIPIPEPYLLAAMCASRSVPEDRTKVTIPEGGERYLMTWHNLLGYEITVDWKRRFATELNDRGHTHVRALRLLFRLGFDFWFAGRRMKLPDVEDSEIRPEDKDLLREFAATRVMVWDVANSEASWSGCLFEYDTRQRSFRIPLIEEMNRRGWHNQCMVCWHPERENIEREISEVATKESRKKGYHLIASRYGVSRLSLAGHRGRKSPTRGRGDTPRSHFSTGSMAPIVRLPRKFWQQLKKLSQTELLIYAALMFEQNRQRLTRTDISTHWIEPRLGLRLDESRLSIVLNHLGSTGAGLIKDFRKEPLGRFQVVF